MPRAYCFSCQKDVNAVPDATTGGNRPVAYVEYHHVIVPVGSNQSRPKYYCPLCGNSVITQEEFQRDRLESDRTEKTVNGVIISFILAGVVFLVSLCVFSYMTHTAHPDLPGGGGVDWAREVAVANSFGDAFWYSVFAGGFALVCFLSIAVIWSHE